MGSEDDEYRGMSVDTKGCLLLVVIDGRLHAGL